MIFLFKIEDNQVFSVDLPSKLVMDLSPAKKVSDTISFATSLSFTFDSVK